MTATRPAPMAGSPVLRLGLALLLLAGLAGLAGCGGSEDDDNSRTASALGAGGLQRSAPQQPASDAAPQGASGQAQP